MNSQFIRVIREIRGLPFRVVKEFRTITADFADKLMKVVKK